MIDAGSRPVPPQDWANRSRVRQGGHVDRVRHRARRDGACCATAATSGGAPAGRAVARSCVRRRAMLGRSIPYVRHLRRTPRRLPLDSIDAPRLVDAAARRAARPAHAARRLADDPHAAALPVGLPRAHRRGARLPGAREARQRRRAAADEGDRRQPRSADCRARGAARAARRLRAAAAVDDAVHRAARIPVRQGDAARGAPHRAAGVPAPARAVAALPPRAPDRRPDARHRARRSAASRR